AGGSNLHFLVLNDGTACQWTPPRGAGLCMVQQGLRVPFSPGACGNLRLSPLIPLLWTIDVTLPPVYSSLVFINPMESSGEEKCVEESHKMVDSLDNLRVSAGSSSSSFKKKPVIIIVVGMAGSGKTSFLHRLVCHTFDSIKRGYVLNLVPAVMSLPFGANIDIRDTVKYKEVMKQYNLGPNVDTPGQIEIFTWSASGAIITEAFASTFPTVVTYVVDTPRSTSPITFMSNMLYACSILYKTRLPLVLAFNKTDVADHKFALEWMEDFEVFQAAIQSDNSYTSTLANSLSLSLADLDKRKVEKEQLEEERREKEMEKLRKDIESSQGRTVVLNTGLKDRDGAEKMMLEKDDDEDFQIEEDSDGAIDEDDEDEEMKI
ncbi:hypothetical protein F2Q69_00009299, partial [Brassica cretica]